MSSIIIGFMNIAINIIAVLLIISGGIIGFLLGMEENPFLTILTIPLGLLAGLAIATIFLGVPLLALRINQNLEEIKQKL